MITDQTDYEAIRLAILTWLKDYVGLNEVVFANQKVNRPAKPYATLLIISQGNKSGLDDVIQEFNAGSEQIERTHLGPRTLTAQVMIYSDPATDLATKEAQHYMSFALDTLESGAIRDLFRNAGIAVLQHTAPNRLDQQLGDRWERRSQTDLTFSYTSKIFDDGGDGSGDWVESVELPTESNGTATFNE